MPQIYEYTYFSQQKTKLNDDLRFAVNKTLTDMKLGRYNTPKMVQGNGQSLVKTKVSMNTGLASAIKVWENRIDGHWRIFYYTNSGGNLTVLCIGHLDPNSRLMEP
jgi:hypothetical protein